MLHELPRRTETEVRIVMQKFLDEEKLGCRLGTVYRIDFGWVAELVPTRKPDSVYARWFYARQEAGLPVPVSEPEHPKAIFPVSNDPGGMPTYLVVYDSDYVSSRAGRRAAAGQASRPWIEIRNGAWEWWVLDGERLAVREQIKKAEQRDPGELRPCNPGGAGVTEKNAAVVKEGDSLD